MKTFNVIYLTTRAMNSFNVLTVYFFNLNKIKILTSYTVKGKSDYNINNFLLMYIFTLLTMGQFKLRKKQL